MKPGKLKWLQHVPRMSGVIYLKKLFYGNQVVKGVVAGLEKWKEDVEGDLKWLRVFGRRSRILDMDQWQDIARRPMC